MPINQIEQDSAHIAGLVDTSSLNSMRILITGASGLVGYNFLCFLDFILKANISSFEVTAISRSGFADRNRWHKAIRVVSLDLSEISSTKGLGKFDLILHAATYGQPGKFVRNAKETLLLNGPLVFDLLHCMNKNGIFLYCSTSEIYSGSQRIPHEEDDVGYMRLDHSRSVYFYSKLFGELSTLHGVEGVTSKIARISLCYGPGTKKDDERVLNQLIRSAITQNKIKLMDQGNAKRVYCYSRDMTEMLLRLLRPTKFSTYNLGGNSRTTIRGLAKSIAELTGCKLEIPEVSQPYLDSPDEVTLNMSRFASEFPLPPYLDFQSGLERTIAWQARKLYSKKL